MTFARTLGFFALLFSVSFSFGIAAEEENVFGTGRVSETGLIGIIYDLKQTQKREPTGVTPTDYGTIITEFLQNKWEEAVFNRYFRAARPLYTTQIFIPLMDAGEAPKAFGMEEVIKPACWIVHYKGQVAPPEDGTYRFLSYADDVIAVAVNGRTVCLGARADAHIGEVWTRPENRNGPPGGNGELTYGDWIEMKKDEPVDLDVIVGERPGGLFCAFLLYEKKGESYPIVDGVTRYPLFQMAPNDTPDYKVDRAPGFSRNAKIWKGYQ